MTHVGSEQHRAFVTAVGNGQRKGDENPLHVYADYLADNEDPVESVVRATLDRDRHHFRPELGTGSVIARPHPLRKLTFFVVRDRNGSRKPAVGLAEGDGGDPQVGYLRNGMLERDDAYRIADSLPEDKREAVYKFLNDRIGPRTDGTGYGHQQLERYSREINDNLKPDEEQ